MKLLQITMQLIVFGLILILGGCASQESAQLSFDEYRALAQKHLSEGNFDDAVNAYRNALMLNTDDANTHFALGEAYYSEYMRTFDKSQAKYIEAILKGSKGLPEDPEEAQKKYGLKTDFRELALKEYELTVKYNPDHWRAHYYIAVNHLNNKRYDLAIGTYTTVISLNQQCQIAYGGLGEAYLMNGEYELAVTILQKAIKLDPGDEEAYYQLGMAYRKLNRTDELQKILKMLKSMKSDRYDKLMRGIMPG